MKVRQTIEFFCPTKGCGKAIGFPLDGAEQNLSFHCPGCRRNYTLPPPVRERLGLLSDLISALRKARPILGESSVAIEVAGQKVAVPYYLLLSRMTSELALNIDGDGYKFRFRIDPLNPT